MSPRCFLHNIFVVIACSFFVFACKRDVHKDILLNAALKKAYNFKTGSYWILKDTLTGRVDSFAVVSTNNTFIDLSNNKRTEQVIVNIAQYNIVPHDGDSLNTLNIYLRNSNQLQFIYTTTRMGDTFKLYNYAPVNYPFSTGQYVSPTYPRDTIRIVRQRSVEIDGKTFADVAAINLNNTYMRSVLFQFNDEFYLNETEGILRISLNHPSDGVYKQWEVVRWIIK